ncbi:MAG TPA: metallopeptidase family protein [Bacteroidota bacterium]|nr:metallopeptidase family protein [Bacteroidota bacterium]
MDREAFEKLVENIFEQLPEKFHSSIENVRIIIEDYPSDSLTQQLRLSSRDQLLGLYQGVPLPYRTSWYGRSPVVPDTISLYQKNIERRSRTDDELERNVRETLIHEIGHYFGMTEEEIRSAGY